MTERDQMTVYILASKDISKELGLDFVILNFKDADKVAEMLKEQEPVKPVVNQDEWVCGCCGSWLERQRMIHPGAILHDLCEYCPQCGKKVDWEAVKQDDQP